MKPKGVIYSSLPAETYGPPTPNSEKVLLQALMSEMGAAKFEKHKFSMGQRIHFTGQLKTIPKQKRSQKNQYLPKKILKQNNLEKLPKTGWNYQSLQSMRDMWVSYMSTCLNSATRSSFKAPDFIDNNYAQFHSVLTKCELTGANIIVKKSVNPSYVDMEGTIVLETQQTFQIVTPKNQLKVLLKPGSAFVFCVKSMEFTIFGDSFLMRPHARSVKKLKSYIKLDL